MRCFFKRNSWKKFQYFAYLIKGRSHSSFKTKQLPLQVLLYPRPRPLQRRQEPQVSGKKAKQCVCSLLVGIITVPSAWRGSAGASQDTATALQHFPQINPVPAQSLVLIWTVSGLEWKCALWGPNSLLRRSAELARQSVSLPSAEIPVSPWAPARPGATASPELPGSSHSCASARGTTVCVSTRRERACGTPLVTPGLLGTSLWRHGFSGGLGIERIASGVMSFALITGLHDMLSTTLSSASLS